MCRATAVHTHRILVAWAILWLGLAAAPAPAQVNYAFEQHVHAIGQGSGFGDAMSLSGDLLAVADADAAGNDVYVYARSGSQWVLQQAIDVPDYRPFPEFSLTSARHRLAVAGDMLVIGSPGDPLGGSESGDFGSVRIYRRVNNAWIFQQRIERPTVPAQQHSLIGSFGAAIAIDGDRMVVGAPIRSAYGNGAVFEFVRVGNTWSHVSTVLLDATSRPSFGRELALHGDRLLIGQPQARRAMAYRRVGAGWQLEATFAPGSSDQAIQFGEAVALSGDYAFVGAPGGPAPDGRAVHVFFRSNGAWGLVQRLSRANAASFGKGLGAHTDLLAVGDPVFANNALSRRGLVTLYERSGLFWVERQGLVYPQATGQAIGDFGGRVVIDGNSVLAAMPLLAAPGANGDGGQVVSYRRPTPKLLLTTPIEFGAIAVGSTSAAKNLLVSNIGNASLTISAIGAATAPFARVSGGSCGTLLPIVVPASGSCTIRYTFAPAVAGVASRSLAFTSNDPGGTQSALLSGTGVAAQLAITPGELFVGSTVVGVPTAPASVTLQNVGAVNLTVQTIGAPAAPFSVAAGGTCLAPPFTLTPGQSCTRRYVFAPTAAGLANSEFTLTSTAANSPHAVSLSGAADGPDLALVSGTVMDFGSVAVSAQSATLTQTLFSSGATDALVTAITPPAGPFERVGGNCATPPFALPPDVSCTLVYGFAPTALGAAQTTVAVTSDSTPAVTAFELHGIGVVAALLIANNPLDLGGAKVGQSTAMQAATLANVGNATLTVTAIEAASAPFSRVGGTCAAPPFALAAGASCTLEYRFTASALGDAVQALAIASTAPGSPANLQLLARGTVATLAVAPALRDFGTRAVGTIATAPVTLSNIGNEPISIDAIDTAAAPFAFAAGDCPEPPFVLPESASCDLDLSFAPAAIGLFEASLALTHSADSGPAAISLRGRGAASAPMVSPSALDFGNLAVGDASAAATVTLLNTAPVAIVIGAAGLIGGLDFALLSDSCSGQTLPAAGTCQFQLRFQPVAVGAAVDLLSIPSDAIASPQLLLLQGLGVEPLIFRNGFEPQP